MKHRPINIFVNKLSTHYSVGLRERMVARACMRTRTHKHAQKHTTHARYDYNYTLYAMTISDDVRAVPSRSACQRHPATDWLFARPHRHPVTDWLFSRPQHHPVTDWLFGRPQRHPDTDWLFSRPQHHPVTIWLFGGLQRHPATDWLFSRPQRQPSTDWLFGRPRWLRRRTQSK